MSSYLEQLAQQSEAVRRQLFSSYEKGDFLPKTNIYGRDFFTIPQTTKAEHMYPDIILVKTTGACPARCAFCFRDHEMVDELSQISDDEVDRIFEYVDGYNFQQKGFETKIKEILITGGDPFLLQREKLERLLKKSKDHGISMIRLGSRSTSVAPHLVDSALVDMLSDYKPMIVASHYNHVDELTSESLAASGKLLNAGIRIKNQSVTLRGTNDSTEELYKLFWNLSQNGIEPYRIYHCAPVGPVQLRPNLRQSIELTRQIRSMSGTTGHFDLAVITP